MRAVILAGGTSSFCYPLAEYCPRALLPVCNEPLLRTQVLRLREAGCAQIIVGVGESDLGRIRAALQSADLSGIRFRSTPDDMALGPGGTLARLRSLLRGEDFLVLSGSAVVETADLRELIEVHRTRRATITAGLLRTGGGGRPADYEQVTLAEDGRIQNIQLLHASVEPRHALAFADAYCMSPEVLDLIRATGHVDLKEQLVPDVCAGGGAVFGHVLTQRPFRINTVSDYVELQHEALRRGDGFLAKHTRHGLSAWIGHGARVSSGARIDGPVLLGEACVVEDGATIIGPTVVGANCRIRAGAAVRKSVLWDGVEIGARANVERSVLGGSCLVSDRTHVSGEIRMGADRYPLAPGALGENGAGRRNARAGHLPWPTFRRQTGVQALLKRMMDVSLSVVGLVLCVPFFAVVTLLIRRDSSGPVFFVQRRCGKGGREFPMYKFRTMQVGADRLQQQYRDRNSVDGPMFKLFDDPRLTRCGRWLRDLGLDELPQLWNVLKGDMSLVGPRPLVMSEMSRSPAWRDLRLLVQPGITGLWQIGERHQSSFHDWIRCDIHYVRNWSFVLDCTILLKMVPWVLARLLEGVWAKARATASATRPPLGESGDSPLFGSSTTTEVGERT